MTKAFTDIQVQRLPAPAKGQKTYFEGEGFGVRVSQGGAKTFVVMYGKDRRLKSLGRYPALSLKDARKAAKALQVTPPSKKPAMSFQEAVTAFLDDCTHRLRPSTIDRYRYSLRPIQAKALSDVPTNLTDPNQIKALKVMFNWLIDHEYIDKNPFIRRKVVFGVRERVLSDQEIASLLLYDCPPYSDIVKLLIATGQRRNQIWLFDQKWNKGDVIDFPAAIMKSKRSHTIPITRYGRYLQNFTFNSWSKSKVKMDEATGVTGYCLHDFRRYFSTTMAKLGVPLHVTEQIIDHRSTISGVAAIYNKHTYLPEMRRALRLYEKHLVAIVQAARMAAAQGKT